MRNKAAQPILDAATRERERQLTQTIRVLSGGDVPPGYEPIAAQGSSIFAKAQVLSNKLGRPVFIKMDDAIPDRRVTFWVHHEVLPALARWLRFRIFDAHEAFGPRWD
jgi:hypothetical protein